MPDRDGWILACGYCGQAAPEWAKPTDSEIAEAREWARIVASAVALTEGLEAMLEPVRTLAEAVEAIGEAMGDIPRYEAAMQVRLDDGTWGEPVPIAGFEVKLGGEE